MKLDPQSTGFSNSTAASQVTGFDGMNFLDSVNGYVPPDTSIAVGTQYVVETVNAQIQIYDKTTGQAMLPNTPLYNFFGESGVSPYQAVATYDDIAGRYIVAANGGNTNLLLAVSIDGNPLDGFNLYNLNVSQFGSYNFNTKIGWNADQVVVTFDTNTYPGYEPESQVISLATSSLFASTPPSNLNLGTDYFVNYLANQNNGLAPATMHGAAPGSPMYFVQQAFIGSENSLNVVTGYNLLSNAPYFNIGDIGVDYYTPPPQAVQPSGAPIYTNGSEILNADWRDGLLVAGQTIGLPTDSDVHARWYELNTSSTYPYLVQDGTISPGAGIDTYNTCRGHRAGRCHRHVLQRIVADRVSLDLLDTTDDERSYRYDGNPDPGQGRRRHVSRFRLQQLGELQRPGCRSYRRQLLERGGILDLPTLWISGELGHLYLSPGICPLDRLEQSRDPAR